MRETVNAISPVRAPKRAATGEGAISGKVQYTMHILIRRIRQALASVAVVVRTCQAATGRARTSVATDGETVVSECGMALPSSTRSPSCSLPGGR